MKQCGSDEALVRCEIFQLALHERKELFLQRRFAQTWIVADGRNSVTYLLFKEIQRNVFFSSEIIEHCPFGDAGFASDRSSRGAVETFRLEQSKSSFHNAVTNNLLVSVAPARHTCARVSAGPGIGSFLSSAGRSSLLWFFVSFAPDDKEMSVIH